MDNSIRLSQLGNVQGANIVFADKRTDQFALEFAKHFQESIYFLLDLVGPGPTLFKMLQSK